MRGKMFKYPKNGHVYRVIDEIVMKDDTTGEWKPAVIYTDGDSAFCRAKADFIAKFEPYEGTQV